MKAARNTVFALALISQVALVAASASAAQFIDERGSHSQAVVTDGGGKIVWLAGIDAGHYPAPFETQERETFANMAATLAKVHGKLSDIVSMTAFIKDARYRDVFTRVRKEIFKTNFPASAQISVTGFAGSPDQLLEIQAVAVVK